MIDYSGSKVRTRTNCREEKVDEDKQTFIYHDWLGNKNDACLTPLCDKCIEAGWYEDEGGSKRLYIGTDRLYQEPEEEQYWPSRKDILGKEEKYNINIIIEVKDGMVFEKQFIEFLEVNTIDYELELKRIYTPEEDEHIKGLISKIIRK